MAGAVTVVDEVHGFKFFDNRDLLGFVDGTENPDGPAAVAAADRRRGSRLRRRPATCTCRSTCTTWTRGMSLSVTEQELVIGRTKLEDIEMADDAKPANSHLALNVIEDDDGNELKIVRPTCRSARLGKGESGTYYIALFARPPR